MAEIEWGRAFYLVYLISDIPGDPWSPFQHPVKFDCEKEKGRSILETLGKGKGWNTIKGCLVKIINCEIIGGCLDGHYW